MPEDQILAIIGSIEVDLIWMLIKVSIAFLIFILLKSMLEGIASYIMFRANKHVAIGRRVTVSGIEGTISNLGFTSIEIKTEDGIHTIPVTRWKWKDWTFHVDRNNT